MRFITFTCIFLGFFQKTLDIVYRLMVVKKQKEKDRKMTTTLIIIGVFAGFFFLVVRPLQKRSGKYDMELPPQDDVTDPIWHDMMPGNLWNDKD